MARYSGVKKTCTVLMHVVQAQAWGHAGAALHWLMRLYLSQLYDVWLIQALVIQNLTLNIFRNLQQAHVGKHPQTGKGTEV